MRMFSLLVLFLVACSSPPLLPRGGTGSTCTETLAFESRARRKLDLLFVIDDSPAMASMEARLDEQLPTFMDTFFDAPSRNAPNLHVGVVSSSLGAGRFLNVPGCEPGGPGDGGGRLVHPGEAGLIGPDAFMRVNGGPINLTRTPRDTFAALGRLGHGGCRFPQPLAAASRALRKAHDPRDRDDACFLRDDAELVVVIITNGDDCSVPSDSDLFDPTQTRPTDGYGALAPYRCTEFAAHLTPIDELRASLRSLKTNPDNILVAVVGGPTEPLTVRGKPVDLGDGTVEIQPELAPSCAVAASTDTAIPAVRLRSWVDGFGGNGIFHPACGPELRIALVGAASQIDIGLEVQCLYGAIVANSHGQPNCTVFETVIDDRGISVRTRLPVCDDDRTILPCWRQIADGHCASQGGDEIRVCRDSACGFAPTSVVTKVEVECQVACR